uniref:Exocyst complex component Sec6 n=1 Tax=Ciona savignyi TaxID=51511 RepID=H2Z4Q2_CIOSA
MIKAESEAQERAIKQVSAMLQRPDQDKVEQYKRRVARKKASVEARLKAAVQSQLDGVKTGLYQMTEALNEVKQIKNHLVDVDDMYLSCGSLSDKMRDIKDISAQHRQLATAMENLKHIFGVPEEVAKARDLIKDGQLLQAHKVLTDLESSRDDLLYEQHRLDNQSESDIKQLQAYFSEAAALSDDLADSLWKVLSKTISIVRKDSASLVTVLRIVEREQRADMKMQEQESHSGFLPPGRPKRWREKSMETLKRAVEDRVESDVYDTREQDKMWLVRHLEILRRSVLDDLRVVKFLGVPCFPPVYNIFEQFVHWYHMALSNHLQSLISDGLEGNEIISLLTWLNQYTGPDLMGHVELASSLDTNKLPPLLDDSVSESLMQTYFETTHTNMLSWMSKSLEQDSADWMREEEPETDVDGYHRTSLPVILFQMIQQTMQVAKTISEALKQRVFGVCIEELNKFVRSYAEAIVSYKEEHFKDRELPHYYTLYMVAATNNCEALRRIINLSFNNIDLHISLQTELVFRKEMTNVAHATCGYLLDEVFVDLKPHFDSIFQRSWLNDRTAVETICVTVEDYYSDYVHLKPQFFTWIMEQAERRVVVEYLRGALGRRIKLSNAADRLKAGEKLLQEQQMLSSLFGRLASSNVIDILDSLIPIAEVIKLQDKSMMPLELSGLVNKYNDASIEQMQALLAMRGDFSASEAKEVMLE